MVSILLMPLLVSHAVEIRSPAEQEFGNFGARLRALSDFTGDGIPELAVTSFHNADPRGSRGAVFVLNGRDFSLISRSDPPYADNDQLADAGSFGWSFTEVPDRNGDGIGELVVGAVFADRPDTFALGYGQAYVVNAATGAVLERLSAPRDLRGTYFGWGLATLPTTANGALTWVAVSAPRGSAGGQVHLFDAETGSGLIRSFRAPAPASDDYFGVSLAPIGDVNGDGRTDLAVGAGSEANENDSSFGAAYIVSGETGQLLHRLIPPDVPANTRFRWAVAAVPDVNGDGKPDVLVGIPFATPTNAPLYSGRACLFSGADGKWLRTIASPEPLTRGFFGWAVAGLPDITGDGAGDLLISAAAFPRFAFGERRTYLIDGATGQAIQTFRSPYAGESFGGSVTGMRDTTGTLRTIVVGTPQETAPSSPSRSGRVYAFPVCTLATARSNDGLALTLTSHPDTAYEIQTSSDFSVWTSLTNVTAGVQPTRVLELQGQGATPRFYRARQAP